MSYAYCDRIPHPGEIFIIVAGPWPVPYLREQVVVTKRNRAQVYFEFVNKFKLGREGGTWNLDVPAKWDDVFRLVEQPDSAAVQRLIQLENELQEVSL